MATGATLNDIVEAIAFYTVNIGIPSMVYDAFTATAAQTSFTTSQLILQDKIQVSVNGVILVNGN